MELLIRLSYMKLTARQLNLVLILVVLKNRHKNIILAQVLYSLFGHHSKVKNPCTRKSQYVLQTCIPSYLMNQQPLCQVLMTKCKLYMFIRFRNRSPCSSTVKQTHMKRPSLQTSQLYARLQLLVAYTRSISTVQSNINSIMSPPLKTRAEYVEKGKTARYANIITLVSLLHEHKHERQGFGAYCNDKCK